MLMHLFVQQLAVVEQLAIDIPANMTVFTGETGAGKSILIDALQLILGGRAESSMIRAPHNEAIVSAIFDVQYVPVVAAWLIENGFLKKEEPAECIIRRMIALDGRSRAYINGQVVTLTQLRTLGEQLVAIHGQHQHQTLLKPEQQRDLLDAYANKAFKNHKNLCETTQKTYEAYHALQKLKASLKEASNESDKLNLLEYQIEEINELQLGETELADLHTEHQTLANAEQWRITGQNALTALQNDNGDNAQSSADAKTLIYYALQQLSQLKTDVPVIKTLRELLNSAHIQITESIHELETFIEQLNSDPHRLTTIENRLSQIHALARKHRIQPENLNEHQKTLILEAEKRRLKEKTLETLEDDLKTAKNAFDTAAEALSDSRKKAALALQKEITQHIQTLQMPNGQFKIALEKSTNISNHGIDSIEFLVSTNPGLPLQPLRKIASGGELSRISLAIQVVTLKTQPLSTLIFDEVDTGISGKTAETVGQLLHTLSLYPHTQVLCVTHVPQIAMQGHHHFLVEKNQTQAETKTNVRLLNRADRIKALASLLGGALITEKTLAHAEELLGDG